MGSHAKQLSRGIRLETLAKQGQAYCTKHEQFIDPIMLQIKHCYLGNHGKSSCPYLKERVTVENSGVLRQ